MAGSDPPQKREAVHMEAMKTCRRCKKRQPISEYYDNPTGSDGTVNHCKTCIRTYARLRAAAKQLIKKATIWTKN